MNQPTFPDGPPVPMMVEGLIDHATLQQLFTDLERAATIHGCREKGAPTARASNEPLTSAVALDRLLVGSTRAVQVRYRFDEQEWTDTIMAVAGGFRVVRCRHEGTG